MSKHAIPQMMYLRQQVIGRGSSRVTTWLYWNYRGTQTGVIHSALTHKKAKQIILSRHPESTFFR